jgi:hypothetical protein
MCGSLSRAGNSVGLGVFIFEFINDFNPFIRNFLPEHGRDNTEMEHEKDVARGY